MLPFAAVKKLEPNPYRVHVLICRGQSCLKSGSDAVAKAFRSEVKTLGAKGIRTSRSFCLGQCGKSCVVVAEGPKGKRRWWGKVNPKGARRVAKKLAKGLKKGPA